jgi:hypothetical protein
MKFTSLIYAALIAKALSSYFDGIDESDYQVAKSKSSNLTSCYTNNAMFNIYDSVSINQFLYEKTDQLLTNVNTQKQLCGMAIYHNQTLNKVSIFYGPTGKSLCNYSSPIICDKSSKCSTLAIYCNKNASDLPDYYKYQYIPIMNSSSKYNKIMHDCNVTNPQDTKCFHLTQISYIPSSMPPTPASTDIITHTTPNSVKKLFVVLYLGYFLPILVTIKNTY